MKASIVDLRYKTAEILKALERNESVTVLYHGKIKGVISPAENATTARIQDHPFFGMCRDRDETVLGQLENLRKSRHAL